VRIGYCVGYLVGLEIPFLQGGRKTYWMFIFGLPLITSYLQLMLLLCTFSYDTPKSLLLQNKYQAVT